MIRRSWVIVCLFLCACAGRRAETLATGSDPALDACMGKIEIFAGPVIRHYDVLGKIQGDRALSRPLRKSDRIEASKDACSAHPEANAILDYQGVVKGDHAWWSGLVVKWK